MSTNLRNIFGTVVHDVPSGTTPVELRQTFVTVVHNVPAGTTPVELRQTFGTVVHNVPDGTTPVELRQTFATVTSQIPPFSVYSADITGTIATSSMFSASVSGEWSSVPKTYPEVGFAWEFVSVPSGSQIAKILPLPDNSVPGGWTDMSDNTTLFHFNEDLNWSDPTTLNNITGSSALSNLGVWEGTLISGSDPANSTSSLGAYSGVEFFGNNKIVTSLTASQLGIDGAKAKTIMLWAKIDESASNEWIIIFSLSETKQIRVCWAFGKLIRMLFFRRARQTKEMHKGLNLILDLMDMVSPTFSFQIPINGATGLLPMKAEAVN